MAGAAVGAVRRPLCSLTIRPSDRPGSAWPKGRTAARRAILAPMGISGTTRLVGILGWPVEYSLSPRMQNAAFAEVGLEWAYVPLPTPPEGLAEAVRGLVALGFSGANVTMPHKVAVTELCDTYLRSVNTLVVRAGAVTGHS